MPGTINLVDDDPSVRKGLGRLLEAAGYSVFTFDSAEAFLSSSPVAGPACLILDVWMPGITGLELQEALLHRERVEQIIFISAHADVPTSVQAMKGGAVDFLLKPFNETALFAAVSNALKRSATMQAQQTDRMSARAQLRDLTPREHEVMQHIVAGLLNKQIADKLGAAESTIKTHRGRVMEKLGVSSVADLVRLVQRAGKNGG